MAPSPPPGFRLIVRAGHGTQRLDLVKDDILIGRSPDCDVVLTDPSVSRQHARILRLDEGTFAVRDLESLAGVTLNGSRIAEARLRTGDVIGLPGAELVFRLRGETTDATILLPPGEEPGTARRVTAEVTSHASLLVLKGDEINRVLNLSSDEITIGRDEGSALCVADRYMSRRHARIVRRPEGYLLSDLGSSNGTFVNGRLVKEARLSPGDEIKVGSTMFRFQVEGQSSVFRGLDGRLELFLLFDVLQLLHLTRRTGLLAITNDDGIGSQLYFRDGEIVDARLGELSGDAAADAAFSWMSGDFRFDPSAPAPATESLAGRSSALLDRALRLLDRTRRTR